MIIVFWDVALCCLVEMHQPFRASYCLHRQFLPKSTAQRARVVIIILVTIGVMQCLTFDIG
jgi:hypothetical protein